MEWKKHFRGSIKRVRPLAKMEEKIKKQEGDLTFLGSVTKNQYDNIRHMIEPHYRAAKTSFKSWRHNFSPSEKEQDIGDQIQEKCMGDKVCAVIIRGLGTVTKKTYVSKYEYKDWEETGERFPAQRPYMLICKNWNDDNLGRDVSFHHFWTEGDTKAFLKQEGMKGRICKEDTLILKIDAMAEVKPIKKTKTTNFDIFETFSIKADLKL